VLLHISFVILRHLCQHPADMSERLKVALLIETSNSYGRELLLGVRRWLQENRSWSIRLYEHARDAGIPNWVDKWQGHGMIARVTSEQMAKSLLETKLPVVDVAAALPDPVFPRVVTDSRAATRLAAEHLIEIGFRNFGYCGDRNYWWSVLREQYFKESLQESGYACLVFPQSQARKSNIASDAEMDALAKWLLALPKPVGILACYDLRGQQVLEACSMAGLKVPDEVAVIGVHNDKLLCDLCEPPLTSVIPNAQRAGYEAASLLSRLMAGDKPPLETQMIAPVGVAHRQSTDVVAVDDPRVSAAIRYIRDHATEKLSVNDVLHAVPMSRTLLERNFKRLLGQTPREAIIRAKLTHVRTMLSETDLPIALIAERTGFEHSEYLSVAFRRETGQTPSAYRQYCRKQD
jgi:LacI family transcriptional regulator